MVMPLDTWLFIICGLLALNTAANVIRLVLRLKRGK